MPRKNRLIEGLEVTAHRFMQEESERTSRKFEEDATVSAEGVVRWKSNDNVPPREVLEFWHHLKKPFDFELSLKTEQEDTDRFLEECRASMANREYSLEEMHEMRNAFGEGETIVNVITGKRTKL